MFPYAESPERERNTLSHLTESIGLVFPNCTAATFCCEDRCGEKEGGAEGHKKSCSGVEMEGETKRVSLVGRWAKRDRE